MPFTFPVGITNSSVSISVQLITNAGTTEDQFQHSALTFTVGDIDNAIIYVTNTGVESRIDDVRISVQQE